MAKVVEKAPGWVARFLLPEIRALIRDEIKDLRTYVDDRFKAFDEKFEAFHEKFKAFDEKFKALDERLASFRNEAGVRFDSLEKRLDVLQRVAVLEAEVKELRRKLETKSG